MFGCVDACMYVCREQESRLQGKVVMHTHIYYICILILDMYAHITYVYSLHMYTHIYYICIHASMHPCIQHTYVGTYTYTCEFGFVINLPTLKYILCVYACMHVCMFQCMYVCILIDTHMHTCISIHTYIQFICVCVCMCVY